MVDMNHNNNKMEIINNGEERKAKTESSSISPTIYIIWYGNNVEQLQKERKEKNRSTTRLPGTRYQYRLVGRRIDLNKDDSLLSLSSSSLIGRILVL